MDSKILEILNQMITIVIYGIVLSREITNSQLDMINTVFTIGGIIISILLMFFIWYLKSIKIVN